MTFWSYPACPFLPCNSLEHAYWHPLYRYKRCNTFTWSRILYWPNHVIYSRHVLLISVWSSTWYMRGMIKMFYSILFYSTLHRNNTENSKQRKRIAWPQSQFSHSCVCDQNIYISLIDLPILLQEICEPILGIYKSPTDSWMWKLVLMSRNSLTRNE